MKEVSQTLDIQDLTIFNTCMNFYDMSLESDFIKYYWNIKMITNA